MLTLSMEHFIFHQEILAHFTSLSRLYEPVSIYLHLFELVNSEPNTLFYFDYKGDRCNENNVYNVVWVFFFNTRKHILQQNITLAVYIQLISYIHISV